MFSVFGTLLQFVGRDRSSKLFGLGAIVGLAFSVAVILATIGIMDGFDTTLKLGLKHSNGDISIHSRTGFFKPIDELNSTFKKLGIAEYSGIVKSEGFLISGESSKGVQISGIDSVTYKQVTSIDAKISYDSIAIGSELAKEFDLHVGDEVVLALPNGNTEFKSLPFLNRYKISSIVTHGIYLKDMRIVYMDRQALQDAMKLGPRVNLVSLNVPEQYRSHGLKGVEHNVFALNRELPINYIVRPYWLEYAGLIEAVQVEKVMIGLILQIIVMISIFNLLAFIIFINEKRTREIFLFRALGMPYKHLMRVWLLFASLIWALSCALSVVFVKIIDFALQHFSMFELPGKIYTLSKLCVELDIKSYALVFGISLVWLILVSLFAILRLKKGAIVRGLRQEFQ